jgi:putative ABC transport system permease protein
VEYGGRSRAVNVYGSSSDLPDILKIGVRQGRYLPEADPFRPAPLAVLGPKLKRELFGESSALGRRVRVGGRRFQVIGVMEPKGSLLNIDLDDCIYIPVGAAMDLFNQTELWEIDILFSGTSSQLVADKVAAVLKERHDGADDVTITTQAEMLSVLGRVLDVVTTAVGAIGGVALLVGGIGILTVMWISVNERVAEIGLCRSIGATSGQILLLFLAEAGALAGAGGILGVATALTLGWLARILVPGLPFHTPPEYMAAAIALSIAVGLASGTLPARRAARLDPVDALRAE